MAEVTGISWTDHTYNPWWGCTKIASGCDNCYAATLDYRIGGDFWNPKVAPRATKVNNRNKVKKWNESATIENRRHRVFCGSMMDWCDKDAPAGARDALWDLIRETPMLDWQLLTKRATLIEECLPEDWGDGYGNVWLGVTCEDIKYGFRRLEVLKDIPAKVKFISAEPLLEKLNGVEKYLSDFDWLIIGGESGDGFRKMEIDWASHLLDHARNADVPVWFKQHGGNGADKGGCFLLGEEIKEWPLAA